MKEMDISIPYYEDNTRVSNSSIGWYIKNGPKYFRNMLDGKEESLSSSALEKGTMIHEYILQPDEFWKDYIILDFDTPKVKQQKDLLEEYNRLSQLNPLEAQNKLLLQAYNFAYSNNKTDDKKLAEALELVVKYETYLNYLKESNTKKVITFSDLNTLKNIESHIKEHKKANELLFGLPCNYETHNEFHINWEVPKYGNIKCKSLLDRVCFDHVNKKIILIDLKTTQNVYDFAHSVELYDYYRQIAYYGLAIQWYMAEILNLNTEDYDFEAYIIAIGKDKENQIRVFDMSDSSIISEKVDLIENTLQKIAYHNKTNQWDHSVEYYESDGVEKLQ